MTIFENRTVSIISCRFSKVLYVLILIFQGEVQEYGVDPTARLPDETEGSGVVVAEPMCSLDPELLQSFKESMSEISRTDPWDISPYARAVQVLNDLKRPSY